MPYRVGRSGKGWKVFKKGGKKSYSKKPMSKAKARRQMRAMYMHSPEARRKRRRR